MRRQAAILALAAGLAACAHGGGGLSLGGTTTGELQPGDREYGDGSHYRTYAFDARRGDTVSALLRSDDFDAYLILQSARGDRLAKNDDGGGDCNALLTYVLPAAGRYGIVVTSSTRSELGAYRLELARGARAAPADTACGAFGSVRGLIQVGGHAEDSLTEDAPMFSSDSTYFRRWVLPVHAGETFTVDAASPDFDPYVLLKAGRADFVTQDDDGGPACDARLVYTPPDDRPLRIFVSTSGHEPRATGRYTLHVSPGRASVDTTDACSAAASPSATTARTLTVDQIARDSLTPDDRMIEDDSMRFQIWTLAGSAGDTVGIALMSEAFDALLAVIGPGLDDGLEDDDSGGLCNAELTVVFPETGSYQIIVAANGKAVTGAFSLLATKGALPPPSQAPCLRDN